MREEQLVIMTMYSTQESMDVQNRRLQQLLDEGWRVVQMTPTGGGPGGSHSVIFLLEQRPPGVTDESKPTNGARARVRRRTLQPSGAPALP